ncbi:MAG TPA: VOC family protein [Thermoleophilaceae bacterium]|nr:VOC family protein [Thermoleophilaceae bacterium]
MNERRLRIAGIHHITLICADVERSLAFYRNLLGMRLVKQTVNEDDRAARHLFFGDEEGRPGTLVTCLEYPELDEGSVGRGSTHHFALTVESEEELGAWRQYLAGQGVPVTDVLDRVYFKSVYLRDPDGHIVELATLGPGLAADEPLEELGRRPVGERSGG